jgi:hypothetical protein
VVEYCAVIVPEIKEDAMRVSKSVLVLLAGSLISITLAGTSSGAEFTDDFSNGIDPDHWTLLSNQPLFTCDDSGGDIYFSKPYGGNGPGYWDYIWLCLAREVVGDFDVSVEFSEAMLELTDTGCNNASLWAEYGGMVFVVVRHDCEVGGENVGVWADPPGVWEGYPETATSGLFRMTRVGITVTGYFNDTVLHQGAYNDENVTELCIALDNSGSFDAVSVRFDNFVAEADDLTLFADDFETGDTSAWSLVVP